MREVITLNISTKTIYEKILLEMFAHRITIKYYWDSHGKLVEWKKNGRHEEVIHGGYIKLLEKEYITGYADSEWKNSDWELYLNDKKFCTDIFEYSVNGKDITLACIYGAG